MGYEEMTREELVSELEKARERLDAQAKVFVRARKAYQEEMLVWLDEQTEQLEKSAAERDRLQQEVIDAQMWAIKELSTPVIPVIDQIIIMPIVGSIDTMRAKDVMRSLLAGIQKHHARVVILDITGVSVVDSGVASHLNKTIQAARLKGAQAIVTGISDAVAETFVDLEIDWSNIDTEGNLQEGLLLALRRLGVKLTQA